MSAYPATRLLSRDLSLLAFNRRVLAQAADPCVPLLERLRFLCIVSSNMDEFFEIRVAGLKEQIRLGTATPAADGLAVGDLIERIAAEAHDIVAEQYALLNDAILPALRAQGIVFFRRAEWTVEQRAWVRDYFVREVMPVLTPIALDPAHPFPRILNKSLNFAVELDGQDDFNRIGGIAVVQAPRVLPRAIRLPAEIAGVADGFVFLTSVMHQHVGELFPGMNITGCHQFRVTRNSDLFVDEEEVKNLRLALQGELPQRHFGDAVRLEVADDCPPAMSAFLREQFELGKGDIYPVPGIVNLVRLMSIPDQVERPDLKFVGYRPGMPRVLAKRLDVFAAIRRQDVLVHHPYQSFVPVVRLLEQAADDAAVVAIKMTLYRTGVDSELLGHLLRAAQKGKEVTVVVELMARFDEEANLSIAARLEEVGAHVVYGVFGYKTHAKMLMVLRREERGYRSYVHLGTGNYHPRTTRFYTDFGLLTCNEEIAADVAEVFKQLTGMGKAAPLQHLLQAPFTLHSGMLGLIHAETEIARAGRPAKIVAKMNSLLEPEIIEALYAASQAGVAVELIVRGVCALRPGIEGMSTNIRVCSVIGRFLEHHRIYYFHADGKEILYLSSADWMERNFFRRIEVAFPVLDPRLKRRVVKEGLRACLLDNCQSWEMDGDGRYVAAAPRRRARRSAQELLTRSLGAA